MAAASATRVVADMAASEFVPHGFVVPRRLVAHGFVLEPLGPEHNDSDHRAWDGSIDHIRATPGFGPHDWDGDTWPFPMSAERNLADLHMHAGEFDRREAFAYTVLDGDGDGDGTGGSGDVIGCVYIDPDPSGAAAAMVRCWVRSDRSDLDRSLADTVRHWLHTGWPFATVRFPGRDG